MPQILPIQQWRQGDLLVDPTGAFYGPNSPPAIIARDDTLGSAIDFARENPRRLGVTVLCGLQTEVTDLGEPGEFESYMADADLYGSNTFGMAQPPGYARRVEAAMINHARPILLPYNTMEWDGMENPGSAMSGLRVINNTVDRAVEGFAATQELNMASLGLESEPEEVSLDAFVGEAHLANHLNWVTVATTCMQVARLQRQDRTHVLVDQGIAGYGVVRTFQAVGVQTTLHELGRDSWPEGIVSGVLDYESALSTGQVCILSQ